MKRIFPDRTLTATERSARWKAAHPEQHRASYKRNNLRRYNLTPERLEEMKCTQNNACAICGANTRLFIDHDHDTGRVRELLCERCNMGLGGFRDDVSLLLQAVVYLRRHSI